MYPLIILGSPRTGTSVIARLLQEELGIMMDEGPIAKDIHNPKGYYEDHRACEINQMHLDAYLAGKVKDVTKISPIWAAKFAQWIAYRSQKYEQWGFKDPRAAGLLHWIKQFFDNPTWIVCTRRDEQVIRSQVKKLQMPPNDAVQGVAAYKKIIKGNLTDYHHFDMSEYQPEDKLILRLKEILNGC